MTTPDDVASAFEAFFAAACGDEWTLRPDRALADLEARRRELRALAVRIDRSLWPPGVAALLWTPAPHEIAGPPPVADVVEIPGPSSDCPACE